MAAVIVVGRGEGGMMMAAPGGGGASLFLGQDGCRLERERWEPWCWGCWRPLESRWPPLSRVRWRQDGCVDHMSTGTKMAATITCPLETRWLR